ncbi:MAG TPA: PKD domain-containing protein, partial [Bacteroidia bacterium]|nr:PKD domain-containing protein [Bacteroidia bacterium]
GSGWYNGGNGGGGGGYSGGGTSSAGPYSGGGGGGSYNSGTKPVNVAGARTGNGLVKIEILSSGAAHDAGVVSIDSPTVFCSGLNPIVVTVQNYGKNKIDSLTLNWTVNGVAQAPLKYIGSIDTIGGAGAFIKQISLGNYNFTSAAHTIKVWSSLPNGVADTVKTNDSANAVKQVNLPAPTDVKTTSLTPTASTIVWTPGSLSNKWAYLHSVTNSSPVGPGTVVTSPTISFTGLTERTTYYFYVREICSSGDSSVWQGPFVYRTPCSSPLNGVYTINPAQPQSATNFQKINDAALALTECTITGPVVFNISAGTFIEQVEIGVIPGASAINTVTFVGASKTTTILTYAATTSNSATLRLNGSRWVTIRDMTIRAAGATFGWGINLLSASNNNIKNCIVENNGGANSTSTNFMGIVLNGNAVTYSTGGTSANNFIDSNTVNAGYYGIYCFTNGGTVVNHYRWNTLINSYSAGAYFNSSQTIKFLNNFISPRTTVNNDGLVLFNGNSTSPQFHEIKNNVIYNAGNRGIYMATSTGSSGSLYGEMINNMIGGGFRAATPYGIYTTSSRWKMYHNTIYLNAPGTGAARAYMQTAAGNNNIVKNNIFAVSPGNANAIPVEISTATYVADMNYNNYYNGSATTLVRLVGINYDNSTYAAAYPNGGGVNSVSSQPLFTGATDLHLLSTYDAPSGDATLGITTDIDGDVRCVGVFTMGADHTRYPQILPSAEFVASDSIYESSGTRIVNTTKGDPNKLSYLWLVDGVIESTGRDFDFAFPSVGNYDVSLIIRGCTSSDTITKIVTVTSPTSTPVVDFVADKQVVDLYAIINLRDASKFGPTQWFWSATPGFDAFFTNDADQNTSVFFGSPGFYDICLHAENALGAGKDTCKDSYIYVKEEYNMCGSTNAVTNNRFGKLYDDGGSGANYATNRNCTFLIDACATSVNLKFSLFNVGAGDVLSIYNGTSASAPLLGSFTGTAIPGGTAGITASSGKMFIRWTTDAATQTAGFAAEWTTNPDATPAPLADFTFPDTLYTDELVPFMSTSTGNNIKYNWDMEYPLNAPGNNGGDEATESYTYTTAGNYDVKLRVFNCAGSNSIVKTITVVDPTTLPQVDFVADNTLVPVNGIVNFTNKTLKGAYSFRWEITPSLGVTIKPNVTERDINASFLVPGTYAVKLVARNLVGPDSITKTAYITVYDYCNPGVASVDGKIGISNVTFGAINNTSAAGTTPYTSYINLPQFATVTTGGTYSISISRTNTTDQ